MSLGHVVARLLGGHSLEDAVQYLSAGEAVELYSMSMISKYARTPLDEETLASHRLRFSTGPTGLRKETGQMWWEAPYGFVLLGPPPFNDVGPWAFAGIDFNIHNEVARIQQVRVPNNALSLLAHLHWEDLLFEAALRFAQEAGLRAIESPEAERTLYYPSSRNQDMYPSLLGADLLAFREHYRSRYDDTPRRAGFTHDPVRHCFRRTLH